MKKVRVEVFQLLFATQEIEGLVDNAASIGSCMDEEESETIIKSFFFEHFFTFDYEEILNFSRDLAAIVMNDYHTFKDILKNITFRLFKRIASIKSNKRVQIDSHQVKIYILLNNLPLKESIQTSDGMMQNGVFSSACGRVVEMNQMKMKVIRYLYKCRNIECQQLTYKTEKEKACKEHICKSCKDEMVEDETGHIAIQTVDFTFNVDGSFGFRPIKCTMSGSTLCSKKITVGQHICITGFFKFDEHYSPFIKVRNIHAIDSSSKERHTFASSYVGIAKLVESVITEDSSDDFHRIILAILITLVTEGKLVISVKNEDEFDKVFELCSKIANSRVQYQTKTQSLSKASKIPDIAEQTIIIPHFESIQRSERESLFRFFERGVINGAVVRAVICICDESRVTQELSLFDLAVRMNNSHEFVSFNSSLLEIVSNAKKMIKSIEITYEQSELLSKYASLNASNFSDKLAAAVCALRGNDTVSEIDSMMSIYYSEERKYTLSKKKSELSQSPPNGCAFFDPDISAMETKDQGILYDIWSTKVKNTLND